MVVMVVVMVVVVVVVVVMCGDLLTCRVADARCIVTIGRCHGLRMRLWR